MSKSIDDLIIGCYKAEAMGFKTITSEKSGKTMSLLSLVVQDYSKEADYIPIELDIWYFYQKKDGTFNEYAVKDVNEAGKAIGSRVMAELTSGSAMQLRKVPLRGKPCYIHVYNLAFSKGNYSSTMRKASVLPAGAYPALEDVVGDDVPFDFPDVTQGTARPIETLIKQPKPTEKIGQRHEPTGEIPF